MGRFLLGAVLLLAAGTVWAQPQNIRGKITDPAGQPSRGQRHRQRTTNGTSAKADGTFELGAAKGATCKSRCSATKRRKRRSPRRPSTRSRSKTIRNRERGGRSATAP
ncbi:MAG: hypothetical protein ACLRM8_00680 [Alistipes sp.]